MTDLKHVGRFVANGRKCLVAYRTLPGDSSHCLVIPTEVLEDSYHDALINLVESNAAQNSNEFAEILARSSFPDGSIMLASLHTQGKLRKVPTDEIEMIPNFQTRIKLDELNYMIAQQLGVSVNDLALTDPKKIRSEQEINDIREIATVNEVPPTKAEFDDNLPKEERATKLRGQADKLSKEAARLRRLAEELVPIKKSK
ncbi:MAG: hypothetical protein EBT86_11570 [Actinobacteria bacterium]|nr:hypothetical protein [Actinomycetota bacterium]